MGQVKSDGSMDAVAIPTCALFTVPLFASGRAHELIAAGIFSAQRSRDMANTCTNERHRN